MRIKILIGSLMLFSVVAAANQVIEESSEDVNLEGVTSIAPLRLPVLKGVLRACSDKGEVAVGTNIPSASSLRLPVNTAIKLPKLTDLQRGGAGIPFVESVPVQFEEEWKNDALTLLEEGVLISDVMHVLALAEDDRSTVETLAASIKHRSHAK